MNTTSPLELCDGSSNNPMDQIINESLSTHNAMECASLSLLFLMCIAFISYVANEKRDVDHPKVLKTVDLGLSGFARQQKIKAAAAAATKVGSPSTKSTMSQRKAASSTKRMPSSKKKAADSKQKTSGSKKKHKLFEGATIASVQSKPATIASGSSMHHQMMMNYHNPPPPLGLDRGAAGAGGRMRASSFEMLLKVCGFMGWACRPAF